MDDVIDMVLNHGLVIDFYRRGSLLGLEAWTVDGRIGVIGLDTYLRLARAVERLDPLTETRGVPERSSRR
ncbi:MAG TPA: hypothetical protein VGC06_10385 [Actinomycetes bacterium]